jgi:hypothetical protein
MRITSIAGLASILATQNTSITTNASAITIINGDSTVAGSIESAKLSNKEYTDAAVSGVDLSQISLNKDAIAILNGDVTIDGSVDKKIDLCKQGVVTVITNSFTTANSNITANTAAITIINGASDVDGSVKKQIADVIGGAPEEYDTLIEVGQLILDQESEYNALLTVIANNKTAQETALSNHITVHNKFVTDTAQKFVDERTATTAEIATAMTDFKTTADTSYFQIDNLFSEISGDQLKQATARTNIGAMGFYDVKSSIEGATTIHKLETLTVDSGGVVLDSRVHPRHIDYIYVPYAGDEYDVLPVVEGGNAGEYVCSKYVDGDLDGENVEVKYVLERSVVAK